MLLIILTFLVTTAFYATMLYLAFRRILRHLQRTPEGVKAVTDHVLIPLLNRPPDEESEAPPTNPKRHERSAAQDINTRHSESSHNTAGLKQRLRQGRRTSYEQYQPR